MPVSAAYGLYGFGGAVGGYVVGRVHEFLRNWRARRRSPISEEIAKLPHDKSSRSLLEQYVDDGLNSASEVAASMCCVGEGLSNFCAEQGYVQKPIPSEANALLTALPDWNFDVLSFAQLPEVCGKPLAIVGMHLLNTNAWDIERLMVREGDEKELRGRVGVFLAEIEGMYNDVPFHNNANACDVMQTVSCFFGNEFYASLRQERFAHQFLSLIAGAVHAVGHTGQTNTFHVATESPIAIRYNDAMPLENFHASSAFQLMRQKPQTDWLNMFNETSVHSRTLQERPLRRHLRRTLISMVLATNASSHQQRTMKLRQWIACGRHRQDILTDQNAQMFALEIALQASVLSASTKKPSIAMPWANAAFEEYWAQGDLERDQFGKVSAHHLDRDKANMPAAQCYYMQFVVAPLYEPLADQSCMWQTFAYYLHQLRKNQAYWEHRKAAGLLQLPQQAEWPPDD